MKKLNMDDLNKVAGGMSASMQFKLTAEEAASAPDGAFDKLSAIPGVTVHQAGSPGYDHGGFSVEAKDEADLNRINDAIDKIFPQS